ncbi:MAG: hypothetical protein OHK0013_00460 [Sandaracinaceae bacterium]
MAIASRLLVDALRRTVARLEGGATFRWTHMGHCNCGHLAQSLTTLSPDEIHRRAIERAGDWTTQALEIAEGETCPTTGLPMDEVFRTMLDAGLTPRDIADLESLSSPLVLATLPVGQRQLDKRRREDAVRYLTAWADLLEAQLALAERERAETSGVFARARLETAKVA